MHKYRELFLDWFNNFLTIERFAEYYDLEVSEASRIIEIGREMHETAVISLKLTADQAA